MSGNNTLIQRTNAITAQTIEDLKYIQTHAEKIALLAAGIRVATGETTSTIDTQKTVQLWQVIQQNREESKSLRLKLDYQIATAHAQAKELLKNNPAFAEGELENIDFGEYNVEELRVPADALNALTALENQAPTNEQINALVNALTTPKTAWAKEELQRIQGLPEADRAQAYQAVIQQLRDQQKAAETIAHTQRVEKVAETGDIQGLDANNEDVQLALQLRENQNAYQGYENKLLHVKNTTTEPRLKALIDKAMQANTPAALDFVMALVLDLEDGKPINIDELEKVYNQIEPKLANYPLGIPEHVDNIVENGIFEEVINGSNLPDDVNTPAEPGIQYDTARIAQAWQALQDMEARTGASTETLNRVAQELQGNALLLLGQNHPSRAAIEAGNTVDLSIAPEILTAIEPLRSPNTPNDEQIQAAIAALTTEQTAWAKAELERILREVPKAERVAAYQRVAEQLVQQNEANNILKQRDAVKRVIDGNASEEDVAGLVPEAAEAARELREANANTDVIALQNRYNEVMANADTPAEIKTWLEEAMKSTDPRLKSLAMALIGTTTGTEYSPRDLIERYNQMKADLQKGATTEETKKALLDQFGVEQTQDIDNARVAQTWQALKENADAKTALEAVARDKRQQAEMILQSDHPMLATIDEEPRKDLSIAQSILDAIQPLRSPNTPNGEQIQAAIAALTTEQTAWAKAELERILREVPAGEKTAACRKVAEQLIQQNLAEGILKQRDDIIKVMNGNATDEDIANLVPEATEAAQKLRNSTETQNAVQARYDEIMRDENTPQEIKNWLQEAMAEGNNPELKNLALSLIAATTGTEYNVQALIDRYNAIQEQLQENTPVAEVDVSTIDSKRTILNETLPQTNDVNQEAVLKTWQGLQASTESREALNRIANGYIDEIMQRLDGTEITREDLEFLDSLSVTPEMFAKLAPLENIEQSPNDEQVRAAVDALNTPQTEWAKNRLIEIHDDTEMQPEEKEQKYQIIAQQLRRQNEADDLLKKYDDITQVINANGNTEGLDLNSELDEQARAEADRLRESHNIQNAVQDRYNEIMRDDRPETLDFRNWLRDAVNGDNPQLKNLAYALINSTVGTEYDSQLLMSRYNAIRQRVEESSAAVNVSDEQAKRSVIDATAPQADVDQEAVLRTWQGIEDVTGCKQVLEEMITARNTRVDELLRSNEQYRNASSADPRPDLSINQNVFDALAPLENLDSLPSPDHIQAAITTLEGSNGAWAIGKLTDISNNQEMSSVEKWAKYQEIAQQLRQQNEAHKLLEQRDNIQRVIAANGDAAGIELDDQAAAEAEKWRNAQQIQRDAQAKYDAIMRDDRPEMSEFKVWLENAVNSENPRLKSLAYALINSVGEAEYDPQVLMSRFEAIKQRLGTLTALSDSGRRSILSETAPLPDINREAVTQAWQTLQETETNKEALNAVAQQLQGNALRLLSENHPSRAAIEAGDTVDLSIAPEILTAIEPLRSPNTPNDEQIQTAIAALTTEQTAWAKAELERILHEVPAAERMAAYQRVADQLVQQNEANNILKQRDAVKRVIEGNASEEDVAGLVPEAAEARRKLHESAEAYNTIQARYNQIMQDQSEETREVREWLQEAMNSNDPRLQNLAKALIGTTIGTEYNAQALMNRYEIIRERLQTQTGLDLNNEETKRSVLGETAPQATNNNNEQVAQAWQTLQETETNKESLNAVVQQLQGNALRLLSENHPSRAAIEAGEAVNLSIAPEILTAIEPLRSPNTPNDEQIQTAIAALTTEQTAWAKAELERILREVPEAERMAAYQRVAEQLVQQNEANNILKQRDAVKRVIDGNASEEDVAGLVPEAAEAGRKLHESAEARNAIQARYDQIMQDQSEETRQVREWLQEAMNSNDSRLQNLAKALIGTTTGNGYNAQALIAQYNNIQERLRGETSQGPDLTTIESRQALLDRVTPEQASSTIDNEKVAKAWQQLQDAETLKNLQQERFEKAKALFANHPLFAESPFPATADIWDPLAQAMPLAVDEAVLTKADALLGLGDTLTTEHQAQIDEFIAALSNNSSQQINWARTALAAIDVNAPDKYAKYREIAQQLHNQAEGDKLLKEHEVLKQINENPNVMPADARHLSEADLALADGVAQSAEARQALQQRYDEIMAEGSQAPDSIKNWLREAMAEGNDPRLKNLAMALIGTTEGNNYNPDELIKRYNDVRRELLLRPENVEAKTDFLSQYLQNTGEGNTGATRAGQKTEIKRIWNSIRAYSEGMENLTKESKARLAKAKELVAGNHPLAQIMPNEANPMPRNKQFYIDNLAVNPDILAKVTPLVNQENPLTGDALNQAYADLVTAVSADNGTQTAWARTEIQRIQGLPEAERAAAYQRLAQLLHNQNEACNLLNNHIDLEQIIANNGSVPADTALEESLLAHTVAITQNADTYNKAKQRCDDLLADGNTPEKLKKIIEKARTEKNPSLNHFVMAFIASTPEGEQINVDELERLYNQYHETMPRSLPTNFNGEEKTKLIEEASRTPNEETIQLVSPEATKAWHSVNLHNKADEALKHALEFRLNLAQNLLKHAQCFEGGNPYANGVSLDANVPNISVNDTILAAGQKITSQDNPSEADINAFINAIKNDNSDYTKWTRKHLEEMAKKEMTPAQQLQHYKMIARLLQEQTEAYKMLQESRELNSIITSSTHAVPANTTLDATTLETVQQLVANKEAFNAAKARYDQVKADPNTDPKIKTMIEEAATTGNTALNNLVIALVGTTQDGYNVDSILRVYADAKGALPKEETNKYDDAARKSLVQRALRYTTNPEEKTFLTQLLNDYNCDFSAAFRTNLPAELQNIQPSDQFLPQWIYTTRNIALSNANARFYSDLEARVNQYEMNRGSLDLTRYGDKETTNTPPEPPVKPQEPKPHAPNNPNGPNSPGVIYVGPDGRIITPEEKARLEAEAAAQKKEEEEEGSWWSRNWTWIAGLVAALAAAGLAFFFTRKYKKDADNSQSQVNSLQGQIADLQNQLNNNSNNNNDNNNNNNNNNNTITNPIIESTLARSASVVNTNTASTSSYSGNGNDASR